MRVEGRKNRMRMPWVILLSSLASRPLLYRTDNQDLDKVEQEKFAYVLYVSGLRV
jgi:hypothetical protein